MEGRSSGAERQWRPVAQGPIRNGTGANGHEMGRRRWRMRLRGLGRGESRHDGEGWPESAPAAALLEVSSTRARGRRSGGGKQTRLRGDNHGRASAAGEVRRRPTHGIAGAVAGRRHGRAYGVTGEHSNRVELV